MTKISIQTLKRQTKNSLPTLYGQLGTAYYLNKYSKTKKGKNSIRYSHVNLEYKKKTISKSKAQKEGKTQYKKFYLKLKRLICVKLNWCKKSKKISKGKNALTYAMLVSQIISIYIPFWALSGGVLAIFLKLNKDFDKLCKCKISNLD